MTSVPSAEARSRGAPPASADARAARGNVLPGDALLHPVTVAALAILMVNDHVLQAAWPGAVTGKLSDVAGMVFLPLLLVSAAELALALVSRWRAPSVRVLAAGVSLSGIAFALSKTVPAMTEASEWGFGLAQWVLTLPMRALAGASVPPVGSTSIVPDPTDLIALPCLAVAFLIGMARVRRANASLHAVGSLQPCP